MAAPVVFFLGRERFLMLQRKESFPPDLLGKSVASRYSLTEPMVRPPMMLRDMNA